MKRRKIKILES